MMSRERLSQLRNTVRQADDSESGKVAKAKAIAEIQEWRQRLFEFTELNPGTDPAIACGEQIISLNDFIQRYQ